ncbi:hypothetical protein NEUTE1DRAFT_108346 [Neurospora tetrasperma FGSC 2508]|uniref:Uncharacterized protein n=1 Tax=Neurospora tetrasperma (strain FGSC 2508 / ATCC MYA-4615 / P0657) TaxID=510951 RepID=F8MH97_NEUT8|nr:uncharacterized protein NEUTE1DRAFT_108346 [Neurospora tetrasperma FGSC 2508]EGO58762.1 hypothetical protein NEUTE1DRAFT_108346 [Neurospora tetrasperma FGSC 2508]EGZ72856.1 hypothetical protein NEUTE2DRAFT_137276 [Neurospora tetrasperma FGSC 2509]
MARIINDNDDIDDRDNIAPIADVVADAIAQASVLNVLVEEKYYNLCAVPGLLLYLNVFCRALNTWVSFSNKTYKRYTFKIGDYIQYRDVDNGKFGRIDHIFTYEQSRMQECRLGSYIISRRYCI